MNHPTSHAASSRAGHLATCRGRGWWAGAAILLGLVGTAPAAWAGMPTYMLTDLAKARIEVISFFLVAMLVLAWGFKVAWNVLGREFTSLPRLRYRSALGLMVVACVLLGLILTMITGARELMTPAAWTKVGATHQVNMADAAPKQWVAGARQQGIERVHAALTTYAMANQGVLPADRFVDGIDPWIWRIPGPQPGLYAYRPPPFTARLGDPEIEDWLLAWEPDVFGANRLVLLGNGSTTEMTPQEVRQRTYEQDKLGVELARKRAQAEGTAAAGEQEPVTEPTDDDAESAPDPAVVGTAPQAPIPEESEVP